jgi:hypothetical protein
VRGRLKQFREDLRRGRHLDAYLAAGAAIALGVAGLFGLGERWLLPVLLLCLVPLLAIILTISHRIDGEPGQFLAPAFPADQIAEDWARSDDLLLVGITLIRTVRSHESDIARRVASGSSVRVLLVDPDDRRAMVQADQRRQFGEPDPEGNAEEVRITLRSLAKIASQAGGSGIEVRTIGFPLGIGGMAFGFNRPSARLYVSTYPFQTGETQPHFALGPRDEPWFDHFSQELQNIWRAGKSAK